MEKATVTIEIPAEVYERAEDIAGVTDSSPESLLLDSLNLLFATTPDIELELDRLKSLDDRELIAIVYQRLAMPEQPRLRELAQLAKTGQAMHEEIAELEYLNDLLDRHILLRSEALLLLKQRGHAVQQLVKLGA